jgi:hypothetical protein
LFFVQIGFSTGIEQIQFEIEGIRTRVSEITNQFEGTQKDVIAGIIGQNLQETDLSFKTIFDAINYLENFLNTIIVILPKEIILSILQSISPLINVSVTYEGALKNLGHRLNNPQKATVWGKLNYIFELIKESLKESINEELFSVLLVNNADNETVLVKLKTLQKILNSSLEMLTNENAYKLPHEKLVSGLIAINEIVDIDEVISNLKEFIYNITIQPLFLLLKNENSVEKLLMEISGHEALLSEKFQITKQLIGLPSDVLLFEQIEKKPTIFALFNKIAEILSKEEFFLAPSRFSEFLEKIGDVQEIEFSQVPEHLIPTVMQLLNILNQKETIIFPSVEAERTSQSLFSILYSILEIMLPDYARLNFSARNYIDLPNSQNFLKDLKLCRALAKKPDSPYKERQNINKLYICAGELEKKIENFLLNQNRKEFIDSTENLLNELLFREKCNGCVEIVSIIDLSCAVLKKLQQNIGLLTEENAWKFFNKETFEKINEFLKDLKNCFNTLSKNNECIFNNINAQNIKEKISNLYQILIKSFDTDEELQILQNNNWCTSIPLRIYDFSQAIKNFAENFRIPQGRAGGIFDEIKVISNTLLDFQILLKDHLITDYCSNCKAFKLNILIENLEILRENFNSVYLITRNYFLTSLKQNLSVLANVLNKISSYCNTSIIKSRQVLNLLENEIFRNIMIQIAEKTELITAQIVKLPDNFLNAKNTNDIIVNCAEICIPVYELFKQLSELLKETSFPEIPDKSYARKDLTQIFEEMAANLQNISNFWKNFYTESHNVEIYGNGWIVEVLQNISTSYEIIADSLNNVKFPEFLLEQFFSDVKTQAKQIAQNTTNLSNFFEKSCPNKFLDFFAKITKSMAIFSKNLEKIPFSFVSQNQDIVNKFLRILNGNIIHILAALSLLDLDYEQEQQYCLHVKYDEYHSSISETINSLSKSMIKFCEKNQIPYITSFSTTSTLDGIFQLILDSAKNIKTYLENVLANIQMPNCNNLGGDLLGNISILCDEYQNLLNCLNILFQNNKLCLYNNLNYLDFSQLSLLLETIGKLVSDLKKTFQTGENCFNLLFPAVLKIYDVVKNIFENIAAKKLTNKEILEEISIILDNLNNDTNNMYNFFVQSESNYLCITAGAQYIENITSNLNKILIKIEEQKDNNLFFSEESIQTKELIQIIINIAQKISLFSENLLKTSEAINSAYIPCSQNLEGSSDIVKEVSEILKTLSVFIQDRASQAIEELFFKEYELYKENILNNFIITPDMNIAEWLRDRKCENDCALGELKKLKNKFFPELKVETCINSSIKFKLEIPKFGV